MTLSEQFHISMRQTTHLLYMSKRVLQCISYYKSNIKEIYFSIPPMFHIDICMVNIISNI